MFSAAARGIAVGSIAPRPRVVEARRRGVALPARASRSSGVEDVLFGAPSKPTPPTREDLERAEARANEARATAERASRDLYDAMALWKQTEAPLMDAEDRARVARQTVEDTLQNLNRAERARAKALDAHRDPSVANADAVAAKRSAADAMTRASASVRDAQASLDAARERLDDARRRATNAAVAAADDVDDAQRTAV